MTKVEAELWEMSSVLNNPATHTIQRDFLHPVSWQVVKKLVSGTTILGEKLDGLDQAESHGDGLVWRA